MAMLNENSIKAQLDSSFWDVQVFDTVESTNLIVKDHIAKGDKQGFAAVALQQVGGYGRQGRQWISPYGGLYVSFAVTPKQDLLHFSSFALVVSLAVRSAMNTCCGLTNIDIKWPNDVLCKEAKIAGISLEVVNGKSLCAGIGFNIFKPYEDVITSTKYEVAYLSHQFEVSQRYPGIGTGVSSEGLSVEQKEFFGVFLVAFLHQMERYFRIWNEQGFKPLKSAYSQALYYKGYSISMLAMNEDVMEEGTLVDVDDLGRLIVRKSSGELMAVSSGEVHITGFKSPGQR